MKKTTLKTIFLTFIVVAILAVQGQAVLAATLPQVQTNSASNVQNYSATLNGYVQNLGNDSYANAWFQWGINTSYGNETSHQSVNYPENFSFSIYNLAPNTTFHFRAVAQNNYSTVYGSDTTFTTGQSGSGQVTANAGPDLYVNSGSSATLQGSGYDNSGNSVTYHWSCVGGALSSTNIAQPTYTPPYVSGQGTYTCTLTVTNNYGYSNSDSCMVYVNYNQQQTGYLLVDKKVINLTQGNLNWQTSVNAKPGDVLSFAITLQAQGQDVHNIFAQDILPSNLIYKDNLLINASINYAGNPASGISIGTLPAGQIEVISYQAQVASATSLPYGSSSLISTATVTSTESGTQTAIANVLVNNSLVQGATTISTGLTNNLLADSFFLPFLIIILGSWFYFSGTVYKFADRFWPKG